MSVWLERTDGRADARDEDARFIVDATCRRANLMLIMAGTNHLAMEGAPCMVLHSIQTLHAECHMKTSAQWACVCPRAFSTFKDRSFGGLSDVLKKRLGVGLLGSLTTCTFRRLVHVSLGQRMVFVRLINETEPLQ